MVNKLMREENKNENNSNILNKDKELWRIGVICKKEIVSSSYTIKCRKRIIEENKINEKIELANPLIVEIKIFGEVEADNKHEFLVDIHKKSGAVMEFLQFSSTLISSMQQEGLVIFK